MAAQPKHINLLTLPAQTSAWKNCITKTIKSLFLFCTILTISFCPTNSFAQYTYELDKTTRFEKMGAEDGLSSEYTTCIHQDKYGFIWIGTQFGLNLYDGYEVKVFNIDSKNPRSLFNNYIHSIYEEADGTMWFCTSRGISKYNRANQTFSNFLPDTSDIHIGHNFTQWIVQEGDYLWVDVWEDLFRFNKQTGEFKSFAKDTLNPLNGIHGSNSDYIFVDSSGVLWVGSSEIGGDFALNRFNKETETFIHYVNDLSKPESFVGKKVMSMIQDHEGTIWVATWGGGLLGIIDKEKGKFRQYVHDDNDKNSIIHNDLQKVFNDSKGNVWIGGSTGFSKLNKNTSQFTNYQIPKRSDNYTLSNTISDIIEDSNGDLWLNAREGFFSFKPQTKVLRHYLYDSENHSSISANNVRQIINDRNGQVWMVTQGNGINRINRFSNAFRKIQKKANVNNSLTSNIIGRFLVDSKGNFWVGCYGIGGLNRTKINKQKVYDNFEHFVFNADDPKSISANDIYAIYEDQDQILWFGTTNGLNSYDFNTNSFTHFQHKSLDITTISGNTVESIFEDSHGTFWVGTRNGLNIMDKGTGKFIRFLPDDNDKTSISSIEIREIFEDSYGELWFGGNYLEKLNRKDTSFIHYLPDTRNKSDIYRTGIFEIEEDDSTNLWLSSLRGGLYKMNRNKLTFSVLTTDHGLPSNSIKGLEIDDNGDIWVTTNQGLSRINYDNNEIKNFDMEDGLVSLEFIDRSSYKDDDGWLYFGSRDGFNVFHPDSIKENKIIPPRLYYIIKCGGRTKIF